MEKKKLAAAIAAVYACIRTSEEAMAYAAPQETQTEPASARASQSFAIPGNTWGMTGRQNQMQANSMMLMRIFK